MKSYEETLLKLVKTTHINQYENLDSLKKKNIRIFMIDNHLLLSKRNRTNFHIRKKKKYKKKKILKI